MGFMDKLKSAGASALKGVGAMAATSYGIVIDGKHKLCKISMNTDYNMLVFIKLTSIEEQCVIKDTVKTFTVVSDSNAESYHVIRIHFNDGETCDFHIEVDEKQGSGLATAEQRLAAHYEKAALFLIGLTKNVPEISDETKAFVNKIMRFARKEEFK